MTIAYVNSGTFASGTTSAAPGTPSSPAAGRKFIAFLGTKPYNASQGTPTNWTKLVTSTSGTSPAGNGTGSTICTAYSKDVLGTESGAVTFTMTTGDPAMARIHQFSKDSSKHWDVATTPLADTNNAGDNHISAIEATGPDIDIQAGDMLVWAATMPNDNDLIATPVMTVPGCTVSAVTTIATNTATDGNDGAIWYYYATVTAGASTGSPVFTAVTGILAGGGSDPDDTACPLVRLREVSDADTGTLTSTLGAVSAAFAVTESIPGALAGTCGSVSASFGGSVIDSGSLTATLSPATASLGGAVVNNGSLSATLSAPMVSFSGAGVNSGDLSATLGSASSAFEGSVSEPVPPVGTMNATAPAVGASLAAVVEVPEVTPPAASSNGWYDALAMIQKARIPLHDDRHKQRLWPK